MPVLDRLALARKKRVRLAHQFAVFGKVDLARARAGAALDLIEQARPRAALEEWVGTRAQQKRALQRGDGSVHRPDRGERPVVTARPAARTAVLEDLRRPVVGGDQNVGKRLVVAQQHVEARTQSLDQVGFKQQRLGLGGGRDEFQRCGRRHHALDARVVAGGPTVGQNPFADVLGFADVEHVPIAIDHAVDAGRCGRELGIAHDRRVSGGERAGGREIERALRLRLGQCRLLVLLDELGRGIDIVLRSVHGANVSGGRACGHRSLFRSGVGGLVGDAALTDW